MSYNLDFQTATSAQIAQALGARLEQIRLSRNMTQQQLAEEAGLSTRTIGRFERGEGAALDTFLRVLIALRLQQPLETMLPDPSIRPVERIATGGRQRRRARPKGGSAAGGAAGDETGEAEAWRWGDEADD